MFVPNIFSFNLLYKEVSINGGAPQWMVYNGKFHQHGWFGGTPILGPPLWNPVDLPLDLRIIEPCRNARRLRCGKMYRCCNVLKPRRRSRGNLSDGIISGCGYGMGHGSIFSTHPKSDKWWFMPISWWKSFGDDDLIHITLHMIIIPFACLYRQHCWEGLMGFPGFDPYGPAGIRARCVPILLGKGGFNGFWRIFIDQVRFPETFCWVGTLKIRGRRATGPSRWSLRWAMRKWGGTVGNLFDSGEIYKWLSLAHQTSCWAYTTSPGRPGSPWHRSLNLLAGNACHSSLPLGPWLPFATRWPSSKRLLNQ